MYMHLGNFICYFHYTHTCEALEPGRGRRSQQDSIIIMNESINQSFRYSNFINKCFDSERNDLKEKQRILKLFSNFYNVSLLYPPQDGLRFLKIGEKSWFFFFLPVKLSHPCAFSLLPTLMVPIYNLAHMYIKNMDVFHKLIYM